MVKEDLYLLELEGTPLSDLFLAQCFSFLILYYPSYQPYLFPLFFCLFFSPIKGCTCETKMTRLRTNTVTLRKKDPNPNSPDIATNRNFLLV